MSKSYKTFSDWLNDQSESVQKRMEMISGALAWDQALLHSEHVKQLEASHRIKIENGNQPVNAQLLEAAKTLSGWAEQLLEVTPEPPNANCSCHISPPCNDCVDYSAEREARKELQSALDAWKSAIAAAEQQPPASEPVARLSWDDYNRARVCVNACEGLSTENLENNLPLVELVLMYNSTIKQRDQLLAALEGIKELMGYEWLRPEFEQADAAIKAAKGE